MRDAFTKRGHSAVSCDILPSETPGEHYQGDVRDLLHAEPWDLVVAFPPCTDLSAVGAVYWPAKQADGRQQAAFEFFLDCYNARSPRVAVENPVGWVNTNWRKPDQIINPNQFGHPVLKKTCLWLRGLPPLVPTNEVPALAYHVGGQRHGGRKIILKDPGHRSGHERSRTFQGIANAMADQWGGTCSG